MRGFRLSGWQRTGIGLSVLWVSCVSMWFMQQSSSQEPGIASVYVQCIAAPDSHRSVCEARAKSFGERAGSEVPAKWPWITFAPVFVVWILAYIAVWLGRWIVAPVALINAATQADTRNMPRVELSTSRRR